MKIIVSGSLGHISKPLTEELVKKGHAVTVVSSNPEKQKDIEALGANAAIGSLEDADFLASTFAGADSAYCMTPPSYAEPDQVSYFRIIANNYASAIQQSGVKRVVLLSSYGADLDKGTGLILGAHNAEDILSELQGLGLTLLRPGYFYYNLYNFTGMIKHAGIIGSNYGGDDKLLLVAPADIASAIAEELTNTINGTAVRYVASDERTCNEVAQVLGAAIGKPGLQWTTFSDDQTQQGMLQQGMPAGFVEGMVELGAALRKGILQNDYLLHKPATLGKVKLEDFAKEFAVAFNKE